MTLIAARMADSVDVEAMPWGLSAYAGYVDGAWPTFAAVVQRFYPHAHCVSITTTGGLAAVLDCEPGDVWPTEHAVAWLEERLAAIAAWEADRPHGAASPYWTIRSGGSSWTGGTDPPPHPLRPGLYFPASRWPELEAQLSQTVARYPRSSYRLWGAEWTREIPNSVPHGWDAVQYNGGLHAAFDMSLLAPSFFGRFVPAEPLKSADRLS